MTGELIVIAFSDDSAQALSVANALSVTFAEIARHRFPDGESRITLPTPLSKRVILYQTLNNPNAKLVELLIAAKTARRNGVEHLTLIAPYLCYMRQDMAFHPGEAVSQTIIGEWLAQHFDAVITVDPHLHRVHRLVEAVPVATPVALSAAATIGAFLRAQQRSLVLIGPDEESAQWVSVAAAAAGCRYGVCRKVRHADRKTTVSLPTIDLAGADVVLIDDIASSGGTLMSAARACRAAGAKKVEAAVTHALFDDAVAADLQRAGIGRVWSTDSVVHATNAISLAALLAAGFRDSVQYPQGIQGPSRSP